MNTFNKAWSHVQQRINNACIAANRDASSVRLLAVGKQHPASSLATVSQLGQKEFGENRVDEAIGKQQELAHLDLSWHFIGPIQSRKTRDIARHFDWVQSVDRAKVLQRLNDQRPDDLPELQLCLQVNIDREPQKSGVFPDQVEPMAALACTLPRLRFRGLMCIPRAGVAAGQTRDSFREMHQIYQRLIDAGYDLDTLSMGMSGDLEIAIAEGSTMIRVGTDLFGPRPAAAPAPQSGNTRESL